MLKKITVPVSVSLLVSLLHIGCCLFPLLTIVLGSVSWFGTFALYKPIFTVLQVLMSGYLAIVLARNYLGTAKFHSQLEKYGYLSAFIIAVAGLLIGIFEPFRSENQRIAQQQFEIFKTHRQIELRVGGNFDSEKLKETIIAIEGVRPASVTVGSAVASCTFKSTEVTPGEIVARLESEGYVVQVAD